MILYLQAKADIRAIPQCRFSPAIHRLAKIGVGPVKTLKAQGGEKRLRVGDFRVLFDETEDTITVHRVGDRREAYR